MVAAFFLAFGGLHYGFFTRNLLKDTPIYERYGDAIVHHGKVPYRDFAVEYPPGALPVFAAPSVAAPPGDFTRYSRLFEVLMLACGAAASAVVGYILVLQRAGATRLVGGILLAGLAPLALGPVVLSRFDLWPAALTIAALGALLADRPRLSAGLLGGAIAAKIYPAVVLPVVLVYIWRRRGAREAGICAGVLLVVLAACVVPFLVLAPSGVWESVSGQASRPLQIESLGASFLLAAHHLWGLQLTEVSSHGSDNLVGRLPHALAVTQSLLVPAALAAVWIGFARGQATSGRLLRYCAAAVCAFIALGKVLSPQYLVWLIALIPLVRGRRMVLAAGLFVASMVLTQMWFPQRYIGLVYGLDARASWLVLARDLALVALFVTLIWPGRRAFRFGALVVTVLALGVGASFGAALASSTAVANLTHSGLLDETGKASTCASAKPVPATSSGTIAYDISAFGNPGRRARCVSVRLTTERRVQVFSAAYAGRFDAANAQAHYLGDAGACTNLAGATGQVLSYSFVVPRNARFLVEVEDCASQQSLPPYTLDVRGGTAVVAYRSATVRKAGEGVVIRWRTRRRAPGLAFSVYREQDGVRVRLNARPIRGDSFLDRAPPLGRSVRYWIRAAAPQGWSWHGPLSRL